MKKSSRRRPRKRICPPAPERSDRLYVQIAPSNIGLFRFLLEAYDNLGIFTVTDKYQGILLLRFSPHQKREIHQFLKTVKSEFPVEVIPASLAAAP